MAGMLAAPKKRVEVFGLWTFATRLASIFVPLSCGLTWTTGEGRQPAELPIGLTGVLFLWVWPC